MMNSAISTDPGLRPWQLFLLAGMLAATAVVLVSTGQAMSGVVVLSATVVASSLVAIAGYRWLSPLMAAQDDAADVPVAGRARAALEREKALVLRTIKELEFDHAMGKTAVVEFEDMRDRLKLRAVGLIRRLEGSDYRAVVERDLAGRTLPGQPKAVQAPVARVASAAAPHAAAPAAEATSAPATARAPGRATLALVCGGCGGVNDVDARFCKHCGTSMVETPS